jgi:hypothetical protein
LRWFGYLDNELRGRDTRLASPRKIALQREEALFEQVIREKRHAQGGAAGYGKENQLPRKLRAEEGREMQPRLGPRRAVDAITDGRADGKMDQVQAVRIFAERRE